MNTLIKIPFMLDLLFTSKFDCYHLYFLYGENVLIPIYLPFICGIIVTNGSLLNSKFRFRMR
jgi:hypothetical protein